MEEDPQSDSSSDSASSETRASFLVEGSEEYKALMQKSRLHFARHFSLLYERDINSILIEVLGKNIVKRQAADSYDNTYEKVKRWGRQWQHEIVKGLTKHVSSHSASYKTFHLIIYRSKALLKIIPNLPPNRKPKFGNSSIKQ